MSVRPSSRSLPHHPSAKALKGRVDAVGSGPSSTPSTVPSNPPSTTNNKSSPSTPALSSSISAMAISQKANPTSIAPFPSNKPSNGPPTGPAKAALKPVSTKPPPALTRKPSSRDVKDSTPKASTDPKRRPPSVSGRRPLHKTNLPPPSSLPPAPLPRASSAFPSPPPPLDPLLALPDRVAELAALLDDNKAEIERHEAKKLIPPSSLSSSLMSRKAGIAESTGGAIGFTPMVRLNKVTAGLNATVAVKLEYMNPAGSVKDRVGFAMIDDAEKRGIITPGVTTLIEPTSGNMGIALAFCARIKGYKLILCMPASMSVERRALLKAYGAEVILTDPALAVKGAQQRARELVAAMPNCHVLDQFGNPANVAAHYATTGPEVWEQTEGKVDIVCYGVGSGGTLSGVGKYLKEKKPEVEVYPVEPFESSVINGLPHSPHKIQGMGTGFIPEILDRSLFKEALRVHSDDAIAMAKRLATEEAILGGISSGANVCAAIQLAKRPENAGKLIVTNVNSFGERYLSTTLYSEIRDAAEKMGVQSLEEAIAVASKYITNE